MAPSTFLPAFVYEIGNGAIAPINALTAISCGASPEVAAFMLALPPIGRCWATCRRPRWPTGSVIAGR